MINIKDDDHYDQLYYLLHRVPLSLRDSSVKLKFEKRKKVGKTRKITNRK